MKYRDDPKYEWYSGQWRTTEQIERRRRTSARYDASDRGRARQARYDHSAKGYLRHISTKVRTFEKKTGVKI
jgi:hypothetical protein